MTTETVQLRDSILTITNGVAEFAHCRPEHRNCLSANLRLDYVDMLERIESDPAICALIITGAGGSFCSGGDLKAVVSKLSKHSVENELAISMRSSLIGANQWLSRLRNLEVPVIAAVDGAAFGAGMSLALAADFIMASSRAHFCMSFGKLGLIPDMGAFHALPRLIGVANARDLMLTARVVHADEAKRLGFVYSVHTADSLAEASRQFAGRFKYASRHALGTTKRLLNLSFETPYSTLAELESNAQAVETCTPYHVNALGRFVRKEALAFDWDRDERT
ncbi:enoyl-CoA hydratase/isomerase family protein [Paraburkholderia terrae]